MRPFMLAAVVTVALAGPAFAFHCPKDMADIDAALAQNPALSDDQMSQVKDMRAKGEELHNAGDHQGAVDTLAEAKKILGIE